MRRSLLAIALVLSVVHGTVDGVQPEPPVSPAVSPMPELIRSFEGRWTLRVNIERGAGLPAGTEGTGEEVWRAAVGGRTLLSEESWKAGPVDLSLLGIFWWDAKENKLHAMDCNNQGKRTCEAKDAAETVLVHWDGKELTIDEPERGRDGKPITSRVTFKDITSDSFSEVDAVARTPGKFETMMRIRATRVPK